MTSYQARLRWRLALAWAAATLGLAGCASAGVAPVPSDSAVAPSPALPGVCLDRLGFEQGPIERLCLPVGVELTYRYGAARTLIVIGPEAFGPTVLEYFVATLPGLGWRLTGQSATALTFEDDVWQGAFVIGDGVWGLTVRSE
ncbi:MAG: hypothetical protein LBK54_00265 [Propionibacteriaceae bacterium]|nr:hypothetical protein [Propionibacteriaceae bacterium]